MAQLHSGMLLVNPFARGAWSFIESTLGCRRLLDLPHTIHCLGWRSVSCCVRDDLGSKGWLPNEAA